MTLHFNLIDEPWLPAVRLDGTSVELSLRETLREAHRLRELQGETPLVTAALYRPLLAILHRVFGPRRRRVWQQLWQAGQWDEAALEGYFQKWHSRFDLFGAEQPFYQVAQPVGKPKALNTLALEWASGNNAALFDHTLDNRPPTITAPYAARLVVTLQTFHLAGLAGGGLPNFTDTPWARGVIVLVQGNNLFETLVLNLMRYDQERPMPGYADDQPNWERDDPFQPERQIPRGYLDYLTWPSRRLKLAAQKVDGQITITTLWLAPGLTLGPVEDPMKVYRRHEEKGWLPIRFNEERALWRNSEALFRLHSDQTRPAQAFTWLASLLDEELLSPSQIYNCLALGMANDQAKIEFYRHEQMPLPLALLKEQYRVEHLRASLQQAEEADRALYFAGKDLVRWLVSPDDKEKAHRDDYEPLLKHLNLGQRYWGSLEVPFQEFIRHLTDDPEGARQKWRERVVEAARAAFTQGATGLDDPIRGMKATVLARGELERGLSRILSKETKKQEDL